MDELRDMGSENSFQEKAKAPLRVDLNTGGEQKQRRKPGPEKKENTRSEKINCRLTKKEKEDGLRYCKQHGTTESKLLRACYLAAITQTPNERVEKVAEAIARQPYISKAAIREILKKCALFGLLILFGMFLSVAPTVAKYMLHTYMGNNSVIFPPHGACIFHPGEEGCEMVP